jgi:hypothetical protein
MAPQRTGVRRTVDAGSRRSVVPAGRGRELHISEATVKTHLLRSFSKLDVSDRTAAVTMARHRGLLS